MVFVGIHKAANVETSHAVPQHRTGRLCIFGYFIRLRAPPSRADHVQRNKPVATIVLRDVGFGFRSPGDLVDA